MQGNIKYLLFIKGTVLSEPLPHYSLFCRQLWTPPQSLLGKYVIFATPT